MHESDRIVIIVDQIARVEIRGRRRGRVAAEEIIPLVQCDLIGPCLIHEDGRAPDFADRPPVIQGIFDLLVAVGIASAEFQLLQEAVV